MLPFVNMALVNFREINCIVIGWTSVVIGGWRFSKWWYNCLRISFSTCLLLKLWFSFISVWIAIHWCSVHCSCWTSPLKLCFSLSEICFSLFWLVHPFNVYAEYKGDSFCFEEVAFGQGQEVLGRCPGSQAGHSIPTFLWWCWANCSSKEQALKRTRTLACQVCKVHPGLAQEC